MKRFIRERVLPHWIPLSILILLTLAAYMGILGHDFQLFWDDEKYVTANESIRGFTLGHLRSAFTTSYMGNYAPLHIISYMFDYSLWGLKPSGYFLTNIVIHLLNGLLFYALLFRLGWGRLWSFIAAFVFLMHPVQVESVAWISERKNLLAMFFFLAAFLSYLAYRKKAWGNGRIEYILALFLFALALLSKSIAVIFPPMLILYDICFLERGEWRGRLMEKLPFFAIAAAMAWVTIQCQSPGGIPGVGGGRVPWHGGSPLATFFTMLTVLPRYLLLLFQPTGLSAIYDPPIRTGLDWAVIAGGVLIIMLALGGAALFKRDRRLFFWYALVFVGLLPVSQIVPITTLMNDRYLYFPMLGAAAWAGSIALWIGKTGNWRRIVGTAAAGTMLTLLPWLTFARAGVWNNDLTLWSDAASKSPNHYLALYGLAQALQNSGDLNGALPIYLRIHEVKPRHLDTLTHLAALYRAKNMPLAGRPYLLEAAGYYPRLADLFIALGENYYLTGDLDASEKAFLRGLELDPESRDALSRLGVIALREKRGEEAAAYLRRLVSLGGDSGEVEYNLACAGALSGRPDEALKHLEASLRLGFRDRASIERDPDLNSLRPLSEFKGLVKSYFGEKQ